MKALGTLLCTLLLINLSACEYSKPESSAQANTQQTTQTKLPRLEHYATYLELKSYSDISQAVETAQALDAAIAIFLYTPNDTTLSAAQDAWRTAYSAFLRTLIYAYLPLQEPIEWQKNGSGYAQILALLDTWPIEGGYIDHVPGYPFSGIVNDLTLQISTEMLLNQHGFADHSYASLGFHVLEFMLWGQDGKRAPSDFSPQDNTTSVVDEEPQQESLDHTELYAVKVQNHHRRRQFIQSVSEQLQKNLHQLQRRWEPSKGYYAQRWQAATDKQKLTAILHASQLLISDELLAKRLKGNSSEFSHTSAQDSSAINEGMQALLLTEGQPNLSSILPNSQTEALTRQWQENFAKVHECHQQWLQTASDNQVQARQQCRQLLIDQLSLLKKSADALRIPLPNIN